MAQPCGYKHHLKWPQGALGLRSHSLQNDLEIRQIHALLSSKRSGYSKIKH